MIKDEAPWADDLMGREQSANFLTSYLLANPSIKVLNVNSPWGAGKFFFLQRWKAQLSKNHVCVFFNAWETDYSSEPLVALVTCIEQQTTGKSVSVEEAGRKVIKTSSELIKRAAPLIAKGLVRKFTGADFDEVFGDSAADDTADAAGEATTDVIESLIQEQSKTAVHVDEFKDAVSKRLAAAAKEHGLESPAFIFIDELDRCRPTYAIELLERVKHFFELKDCTFIVASDSTQLAHSVRAVYGEKFFSERYLSRFFDAEFRLDNSSIFSIAKQHAFEFPLAELHLKIGGWARSMHSSQGEISPRGDTVWTDQRNYPIHALLLVGMTRYFNVELREMLRYAQQINSMASVLPEHEFHYFWAAFLIFAKGTNEELYQSLSFPDKAEKVIKEFEAGRATPVTFTFSLGHETIGDMAIFYTRMIHATKDEWRSMYNSAKGWREAVLGQMDEHNLDIVKTYRRVVELAHRLS
ncbi:KAP family P-loop NTPase fold protein [Pseudomonas sp. PSE1(2024)]|uniref:KAP family P-loop NTPase fold protein n=1 Tax=Pseudomonas sp. PSE1(2024) TaxID=3228746 RepID=UPI003D95C274